MTESIKNIALALIDEPSNAMRTKFDGEKIAELARSIREIGILEPVIVRAVGDRFEIIAGHRRVLAAAHVGLLDVPCIIKHTDEQEAETMKIHENLYRADVDPYDEARFVSVLIDKHSWSIAEAARRVGRAESWVRSRLQLLDYPDYLQEAIRAGSVSAAAARWLFAVTDENTRRRYTDYAIRGGLSARQAEGWYKAWTAGKNAQSSEEFKEGSVEHVVAISAKRIECAICATVDDVEALTLVYAHGDCAAELAGAVVTQGAVAPPESKSDTKDDLVIEGGTEDENAVLVDIPFSK